MLENCSGGSPAAAERASGAEPYGDLSVSDRRGHSHTRQIFAEAQRQLRDELALAKTAHEQPLAEQISGNRHQCADLSPSQADVCP